MIGRKCTGVTFTCDRGKKLRERLPPWYLIMRYVPTYTLHKEVKEETVAIVVAEIDNGNGVGHNNDDGFHRNLVECIAQVSSCIMVWASCGVLANRKKLSAHTQWLINVRSSRRAKDSTWPV